MCGVEVEQCAQGQGHATNYEVLSKKAMLMINMVSCYENVTSLANHCAFRGYILDFQLYV